MHIGSDHAGFEVKNRLVEGLRAAGLEVVDHGPHVYDALDDYPPFCIRTAEAVAMVSMLMPLSISQPAPNNVTITTTAISRNRTRVS